MTSLKLAIGIRKKKWLQFENIDKNPRKKSIKFLFKVKIERITELGT